MAEKNSINERAKEAVARYLKMKDYEIIERDWHHGHDSADFIALDEQAHDLVFIDVSVHRYNGGAFERGNVETLREKFERLALAYLATAEHTDVGVRMDVISIVVLSEERAMIKHYVNAVS